MKSLGSAIGLSLLLAMTGCAGLLGPPLGLGPGLDEVAGVLIFILLFAALYHPLRDQFGSPSGMHHTHSPQDIAKERYARGEITQDEFQRILRQLSES